MMSISGAYADRKGGVFPLEDAAYGLARMYRFGGQTVFLWSVLEHLLAGMMWAYYNGSLELELAFGLHDLHEAYTSDIVTTFKTKSIARLQADLDERIWQSLGVPPFSPQISRAVHELDLDMLLAEASIVCPPATYDRISADLGGRKAMHTHKRAVGSVLARSPYKDSIETTYVKRINQLVAGVKKRAAH